MAGLPGDEGGGTLKFARIVAQSGWQLYGDGRGIRRGGSYPVIKQRVRGVGLIGSVVNTLRTFVDTRIRYERPASHVQRILPRRIRYVERKS